MATTRSNRNTGQHSSASRREKETESPQEITRDIVDYLTEYAREKPAYAAMWCLGAGFVLGWKLKHW